MDFECTLMWALVILGFVIGLSVGYLVVDPDLERQIERLELENKALQYEIYKLTGEIN